jgi:hypothetical protein
MCCGATENEIALADLKQALALQPTDKIIKREYVKLKGELDRQRVKDSKQFGGLFERGRVVEEEAEERGEGGGGRQPAGSGSGMTVEEALRSLKDAESACKVRRPTRQMRCDAMRCEQCCAVLCCVVL